MNKYFFIGLFFCATLTKCVAQEHSIIQVKRQGLYENDRAIDSLAVNGFKQVQIFDEDMGSEVWVSPETNCVTMNKEKSIVLKGQNSLHVKWDKVTGGCKWIGIGFGWNEWLAKDMTGLIDNASVQLKVRAVNGSFANFPVAFAFEDYTGVQSYCGFNAKQASGVFTDKTWTAVTIPLKDFNFISNGAEMSKIKQFVIQLEGDGDVYIDDIRIVKN